MAVCGHRPDGDPDDLRECVDHRSVPKRVCECAAEVKDDLEKAKEPK